jgi:hypothetical protein
MSVESKVNEVRYLTHMIVFPDEDAFIEQLPFVHDLQFEASNWQHTVFHHQDEAKSMISDLLKKGECRCTSPYPPGGISAKLTHIYMIENNQRPTGWFGSKQEGKLNG